MPRREIESGLVHCGFLLFDCPLKSSTRATVAQLEANDFAVKIITGDNPYTACEIARRCGIVPADREVLVLGEDADLPGLLTTLGNVRAAFGRGEVLKVTPVAGDTIVEIRFDTAGVKKTMANYAPLKHISE